MRIDYILNEMLKKLEYASLSLETNNLKDYETNNLKDLDNKSQNRL